LKNNFKNIVFVLSVLTALNSCVTARRCDLKFPPVNTTETIIRDTTIITERTTFDTLHVFHESRDTVFFHDKETQIKIKYLRLPGDSIFVSAECPPDTVTVTKEIINNNTIERRTSSRFPEGSFWLIAAFIFGLILIAAGYFTKQIKR
jgi:hypothetical protein